MAGQENDDVLSNLLTATREDAALKEQIFGSLTLITTALEEVKDVLKFILSQVSRQSAVLDSILLFVVAQSMRGANSGALTADELADRAAEVGVKIEAKAGGDVTISMAGEDQRIGGPESKG